MEPRKRKFTSQEALFAVAMAVCFLALLLPLLSHLLDRNRQGRDLQNAKTITLLAKQFALDHEGHYPAWTDANGGTPDRVSELPNSNAVLAILMPNYCADESVFGINHSKWMKPGKPDGDISPGKILEAGENAWAYVAGLTDTSSSRWPLLAYAFAQTEGNLGSNGSPSYTNDEKLKGGLWEGRKAVVARCDGSANIETTHQVNPSTFIVGRDGDPTKNAFNYDAEAQWLTPDCAVLQPLPPKP